MTRTAQTGGFSLIEVIVVIIVAAIVFPAIIMPFVGATRRIDLTVEQETMDLLIQGEIEKRILAREYANAGEWNEPIEGFPFLSQGYYYFVDPAIGFNADAQTVEDTGYKRFTVTVTPDGGNGSLEVVVIRSRKNFGEDEEE